MFVALLRETADTLSQARAITDINNSNIAELDTLLDDLNSAQRAGFNREYQSESSLMLGFRLVQTFRRRYKSSHPLVLPFSVTTTSNREG